MHRSGTSALARMLSLSGAALPKHLLPAARGNDLGHWEPEKIVEVHDELLRLSGSDWMDLSPFAFNDGWWQGPPGAVAARLPDVVRSEYGDAPLFMVKDPRLARLLQVWRVFLPAMGVSPAVVIAVRHPEEVARSLEARDGLNPARSMVLWLRYMLNAERDSRGLPRCFVSYGSLLEDWRSSRAAVTRDAGVEFPPPAAGTEAAIDAFLRRDQRHHDVAASGDVLDQRMPPEMKEAFEIFLGACHGTPPDAAALDRISQELDRAGALYGPSLAAAEQRVRELEREKVETAVEEDMRVSRLERELVDANGKIELLQRDVDQLRGAVAAARGGESSAREHARAMESSISWRMTQPVRKAAARFPGTARTLRDLVLTAMRADSSRSRT
jgi:hypothetical protein